MKLCLAAVACLILMGLTGCVTAQFEVKAKPPALGGKTVVLVPVGFGDRYIGGSTSAGSSFVLQAMAWSFYISDYRSHQGAYTDIEQKLAAEATTRTAEGLKAAGYQVVVADAPLTGSLAEGLNLYGLEGLNQGPRWGLFSPLVQREASKAQADYVVVEGWRAIVDSIGFLGTSASFQS